eukprot:1515605-Pyramimonas_sp.AAC.1
MAAHRPRRESLAASFSPTCKCWQTFSRPAGGIKQGVQGSERALAFPSQQLCRLRWLPHAILRVPWRLG